MATPIQTNNNYIFMLCTVEYVDDSSKGLRIKVRIPPYDNDKDINREDKDGIPWCFPMLPKQLNVNPKVGELVFVFCQNLRSYRSQRLFIGPVISQDYMMENDQDFGTDSNKSSARRLLNGGDFNKIYTPLPNPDTDGENEGTIPSREDIAVRGRGNSDIILTDDELRLRCGFKSNPKGKIYERLHFNSKDLAYILMRYRKDNDETGEYKSSINVVADRINLISHDSKDNFQLGDRKELISDKEMKKLLSKAHELPYGDILVDFLKGFTDVFMRHVHPYPGVPPTLQETDVQTLNPNWNNMLSQSIRIN